MNMRFWITPVTWGRISATLNATVRPGRSVVRLTGCDLKVTTLTTAGGGGGGAFLWLHALSAIATPMASAHRGMPEATAAPGKAALRTQANGCPRVMTSMFFGILIDPSCVARLPVTQKLYRVCRPAGSPQT